MDADKLPSPKSAAELLDMFYLETRCHLLETAAAFDRLERAPGGAEVFADPRMLRLRRAATLLAESGSNRTERFLELFSVEDGK